jgi:hypothetical protein
MKKYIIEREIPGAGKLNASELKDIATKSCNVLMKMGPSIEWIQSYVAEDKIYCVYIAESEKEIREHANLSGFPANTITRVSTIIDLATAD